MALKLPPYPIEYLEINFIEEETDVEKYVKLQNEQILPFAASGIFNSTLISARNLTQGNDVKKVFEICLNIENEECVYQPGYTFGILPENCNDEVIKIIERLKFNDIADKLFNVSVKEISNTKKKFKIPMHIPIIGTIRQILTHNLDIRSVPKKTFLRALSKYTTNEEELKTLDELCSLQGSTKYSNFISADYVTLFELLKKFPSCFPPFAVLLEHLPRLLPRPYSVTSSPLSFDQPCSKVRFIYNLTLLPGNYQGVCSGWLSKIVDDFLKLGISNVKIPIYLRKPNNFILPTDTKTNVIMIANGTGLAPFLSFLHHRKLELENNRGIMWLFYGCRYSDRDFLCKNDLEHFLDINVLTKLFTTFSRESANLKYVQDNILANSKEFVNLLENDTILFICGGKNMSNDVFETIVQCVHKVKNCTIDDARIFLTGLKSNNKYIEDIWN